MDLQSFKPGSLTAPSVSVQLERTDQQGALKLRLDFGRENYWV